MDRNFTRIAVLLWVIFCSGQLMAQDIHYTQFYDSPVNLNPAMTGHIQGKYRVNLMYRAQWPQVSPGGGFTYTTPSASFDINFGKPTQGSSWGLGALIVNDQTIGGLTTLEALFGGAYHYNLDGREINYISGGVQVGLIQKRINRGDLSFANQFDPSTGEFNSGINVETGLTFTDVSYPDTRVGITWASYLDNFDFRLGAAYIHLIGGDEGFIRESNIPARLVVHADANLSVGKNLFLRPHVLYMTQAQASQLNFGTHLGYAFGDKVAVYIGAGMRSDDALIAILGFEFLGARVGLVRDFTNTLLTDVARGLGSLEFSLSYTGAATNRAKPLLPAIRFFD